ncbi:MAG TPA: hypothetical protein VG406_29670 [Isosphaeraceae bacterium]|jgi:hypothetical protein|nr:hypothetical protein [Isosphaeraceae bacterium]
MSRRDLAARSLAMLAMAGWLGGLAFYGAAVIPVLHDAVGGTRAGLTITPRVTDRLNLVGLGVLALWWPLVVAERDLGPARARRLRVAALGLSTTILSALAALHRVMEHHLDTTGLAGFYPYHRAYLLASTVQWLANVGVLVASLAIWGGGRNLSMDDKE